MHYSHITIVLHNGHLIEQAHMISNKIDAVGTKVKLQLDPAYRVSCHLIKVAPSTTWVTRMQITPQLAGTRLHVLTITILHLTRDLCTRPLPFMPSINVNWILIVQISKEPQSDWQLHNDISLTLRLVSFLAERYSAINFESSFNNSEKNSSAVQGKFSWNEAINRIY